MNTKKTNPTDHDCPHCIHRPYCSVRGGKGETCDDGEWPEYETVEIIIADMRAVAKEEMTQSVRWDDDASPTQARLARTLEMYADRLEMAWGIFCAAVNKSTLSHINALVTIADTASTALKGKDNLALRCILDAANEALQITDANGAEAVKKCCATCRNYNRRQRYCATQDCLMACPDLLPTFLDGPCNKWESRKGGAK